MNNLTIHCMLATVFWVLLLAFNPSGLINEKVYANDTQQSKERKRGKILSAKGYKIINSAREAMDLEKTDQALHILSEFLAQSDRLKPYDNAKALELQAYIFLNQGDYTKAISAAEKTIALDAMDEYATLELHYRLIHLYSSQEQYDKSIQHLEWWFQRAENPGAQAYFVAAQIYAMTERYPKALEYAEQGMAKHQSSQPFNPKADWYRLSLAIYLELKNYKSAAQLLEQMIAFWPDRFQYFQQLGALYQELNRGKESMVIFSMAYQNALLSTQDDIERLVQLLRYYDYPFKAAVILQEAMQLQRVEKTEKNWEHLANAWLQSREWKRANASLQKAAGLSPTGKHWFLLCQTAFQDEQWMESKQYCLNAIKKGGLKLDEGVAWQLLALSRFHTNNLEDAIKAFSQCARWDSLAPACTQWEEHISKSIKREVEQAERLRSEELVEMRRRREQQERIEETLQL